jgi:hypothetical protein
MFIERKRWSPDAFFYDAFLDVTCLELYIGVLEVELPRVIESERKRIWQDVKEDDEEAKDAACLADYELSSGVATRILTGTALVALWATYESVITRIAEGIQETEHLSRKLRKIRNAKEYFENDLHFDLYPAGTDSDLMNDHIQNLYDLRNALAHANGRLRDVRPYEAQQRVEQLATTSPGLQISENGDLIVSMEFVRTAFSFIDQLLRDLGRRADLKLKRDF